MDYSQMTNDEKMDALSNDATAGEKAELEREYRVAGGIFKKVSRGYSELAVEYPDSGAFLAGMSFLHAAKAFRMSYSAGEQERTSPADLNRTQPR